MPSRKSSVDATKQNGKKASRPQKKTVARTSTKKPINEGVKESVKESANDGEEADSEYEYFNVKCGFDRIFKKNVSKEDREQLTATIGKFVQKISRWMIEASRLIYFVLSLKLASGNPVIIRKEFKRKVGRNFFDPYFNALKDGRSAALEELAPLYACIRNRADEKLPKYSTRHNGNAVNWASQLFRTLLMNNIWMHGRRRIRHFLKTLHPDKTAQALNGTLSFMFNRDNLPKPDAEMIATINRYLKPPNDYFRRIRYDWYEYLPSFYLLQRFFEVNKMSNLRLIPQFSLGLKSIKIDTTTLYNILNENQFKTIPSRQRDNKTVIWNTFFDFEQFETHEYGADGSNKLLHEFTYSMFTDGVSVSLVMRRKKTPPKTDAELQSAKEQEKRGIRKTLLQNGYDFIVGIDPGSRIIVAANTLAVKSGLEFLTKYLTSTYSWATGQHDFKRKRLKLTKAAVEAKEADRLIFPLVSENDPAYHRMQNLLNEKILAKNKARTEKYIARRLDKELVTSNGRSRRKKSTKMPDLNDRHCIELSAKSWNFRNYVEFELKHFRSTQEVLENPVLAHYEFKQWIFKKKRLKQMAREIANTGTLDPTSRISYTYEDKANKLKRFSRRRRFKRTQGNQVRTLVVIGDCTVAANSPIKGYMRTPIRQLYEELRKCNNCDVLELDEFRTTQLCSFCWRHVKTAKSPDRFQQCNQCSDGKRKVWNRDSNASRNIRIVGVEELLYGARPEPFQRGTESQEVPIIETPQRRRKASKANAYSEGHCKVFLKAASTPKLLLRSRNSLDDFQDGTVADQSTENDQQQNLSPASMELHSKLHQVHNESFSIESILNAEIARTPNKMRPRIHRSSPVTSNPINLYTKIEGIDSLKTAVGVGDDSEMEWSPSPPTSSPKIDRDRRSSVEY